MLLGLDGVEIGLIIVALCLFPAILSGFPVAFAIAGAAGLSFAIIAGLDAAGLLLREVVDTSSAAYRDLAASGVAPDTITRFRYPDLPRVTQPLLEGGWRGALDGTLSFIVNRINERVLAGQSIATLLAVPMFVLMGIVLERSRIAEDLLTAMARVFGPLPGGLAVSVVVVGAFLAASTGIVGATVVTMGLLSLPTMLRQGYSTHLSTGVIAASGTLGQIIPPSIVIVLLGNLAGGLYADAQQERAVAAGCRDALTYLGEPAVLSVGTLFQAALLPGVVLAALYAAYAIGYACLNPAKAPPIALGETGRAPVSPREGIAWFAGVPLAVLAAGALALGLGLAGGKQGGATERAAADGPVLRTDVSEECRESMIALHGQATWDLALAQREAATETSAAAAAEPAAPPPVGTGVLVAAVLAAVALSLARGTAPTASAAPLAVGAVGLALVLAVDAGLVAPGASAGTTFLMLALPGAITLWSLRHAARRLAENELLRVVFPPLVLIVAVLGSILGGITNPTPAVALGAAGAIMLAAYRHLAAEGRGGRLVTAAALAVVVMILAGVNFDLRVDRESVPFADWIAFLVAQGAYHLAVVGLLYSCWVLLRGKVLRPAVQETAKVTSMVFTILVGSQLLNLVVISFGGEDYIQTFLESFDSEVTVFLIVMLVLFLLGFVLDFLEIIYIVVPIVGPVIYGGGFDPGWVTIMIAVNLQTSFLTPPFGFALFYLRGVAPPGVTTLAIYRGVLPFVAIQIAGLMLLWSFPAMVTLVPDLIGG